MSRFIGALAVVLVLCAVPASAWAHARLRSAVPPPGGSVKSAPTELELVFSEGVNLAFTGIALTGPGGVAVPTGKATLRQGSATTLAVPVAGPIGPGAYTVEWHALAVDGHKTEGRYGFTVAP